MSLFETTLFVSEIEATWKSNNRYDLESINVLVSFVFSLRRKSYPGWL